MSTRLAVRIRAESCRLSAAAGPDGDKPLVGTDVAERVVVFGVAGGTAAAWGDVGGGGGACVGFSPSILKRDLGIVLRDSDWARTRNDDGAAAAPSSMDRAPVIAMASWKRANRFYQTRNLHP